MQKFIAIDFGGSNIRMSYIDQNGKANIIRNLDGDLKTANAFYLENNGESVIGEEAKESYIMDGAAVLDLKATMLKGDNVTLRSNNYTAREISARMIKQCLSEAQEYLHDEGLLPADEEIFDVALSIPETFTDSQVDDFKAVINDAGFNTICICRELACLIESSFYAHAYDQIHSETTLYIDLGGTSTKIYGVHYEKRNFTYILNRIDYSLGGKEFDKILCDYAVNLYQNEYQYDLKTNESDMHALLLRAEQWKEALSTRNSVKMLIQGPKGKLKKEITREFFENVTHAFILDLQEFVNNCINEIENRYGERIDRILLFGGGAKMPCISAFLEKKYHLPVQAIDPENAIVKGLAYKSSAYLEKTKKQLSKSRPQNETKPEEQPKKPEPFDLEKELEKIVGLENVKDMLRLQHNRVLANQLRKESALNFTTNQNLNMIFSGNPGTGKTMVARMVGRMMYSMGVLPEEKFVEVSRGDLIGAYQGQTAIKTADQFNSAIGGVFFIDEAYSLKTSDNDSYGQECIDTLVKMVEDHNGQICVILAGYTADMQQFLHANAGLKSRFPLTLEFADYSVTELFQIGKMMMESRGFQFGEGVLPVLREYLEAEVKKTDANSGNGRLIRNIIEDIITRQSNRIITERKNGVSQSDEDLVTIKEEDIQLKKKDYSKFDLDEKLDRIIGLDTLKDELRKFRNKVLFDQAREKQGIKTDDDQSYHMMFKGNPGTGKTMMARIVAELLYEVGIISKNRVIETDRSGLVGKYIGETETKTKKVVESAFGGVLFIDEAYALNGNDAWDYGKKAMDTLIKMMEDHRSQLVVIMAGYTKEMEQLYQLNTGLRSRIAYEFEFPDYNLDELIAIAEKMYDDQHYVLDDDAKEILRIRLDDLRKRPHFGNARVVRQIVDKSIINLANRVSMEGDFTKEKMTHITYKDLGNID